MKPRSWNRPKYTVALLPLVLAWLALVPPGTSGQAVSGRLVSCDNGRADRFACSGMSLAAYLPISDIGGVGDTELNDIWGWTDDETGRRYALVGRTDGTAFVDVTDPVHPVFVGSLPRRGSNSLWRDIKTYLHYAYIVSESSSQGVQVFDLHQLRGVTQPTIFAESGLFFGFGSAHNIVINEATGFAYAVGARGGTSPQPNACAGGLVMIDLADPVRPTHAGCFNHPGTGRALTGYTHDAQCVVYRGPDSRFEGKEICFGSNETALSIADVSDKAHPVAVGLGEYPGVRYAHQGWLSEDHRYFFLGDELDELGTGGPIRTLVFDVSELDDPVLVTEYRAPREGIDHNMYVTRGRLYQANYKEGIQVLDISDPEHPVEVGRFDTTPDPTQSVWDGTWSVYPFFDDATIIASSIKQGLFVLHLDAGASTAAASAIDVPDQVTISPAYPNPFSAMTRVSIGVHISGTVRAEVVDMLGRVQQVVTDREAVAGDVIAIDIPGVDLAPGSYLLRVTAGGQVRTTSLVRLP